VMYECDSCVFDEYVQYVHSSGAAVVGGGAGGAAGWSSPSPLPRAVKTV